MKNQPNRLLRRSRILKLLRSGGAATCFKSNLSDPRVIEIAAMSGVDSVWLCNEHVPSTWTMIENQIRAAKLYDVDTLVRVEKGSYSDYVKPFEADATGILVPHVTTAEEARQTVKWTRFKPVGSRAMDGGNADGKFCALGVDDYIANNLRERIIVMQIESPEALENLDEILAVPGFDLVCFGPADFAHLSGLPGRTDDARVVAARRLVARRAQAHGKFAMAAGSSVSGAALQQEGHRLITLGADVVGLGNYVRGKVAEFHAAPARKPAKKRRR
ncbi:MAG: aldolase [Verrucomicrobia bacterium]|nr:aldolase [Verrucomicrobiota bacterium]